MPPVPIMSRESLFDRIWWFRLGFVELLPRTHSFQLLALLSVCRQVREAQPTAFGPRRGPESDPSPDEKSAMTRTCNTDRPTASRWVAPAKSSPDEFMI